MDTMYLVRYPEKPIAVSKKSKVTIGRLDKNTIVLNERRVSRSHAHIAWDKSLNSYYVTDLKSSNGTFLNNEKLKPEEKYPINDWDKIRITSIIFTARVVSDPSIIDTEFQELRKKERLAVTEIMKIADINAMQEYAAFSGELAHLCPIEIFQMLESGYKTGSLVINTDTICGEFTINNGQIITAKLGKEKGEEAVYAALQRDNGTFAFTPMHTVHDTPEIFMPTTTLLMRGCMQLDEANRNDTNILDSLDAPQ